MTVDDVVRHFTAPPPAGRAAADLTERDKVALAIGAGVTYELVIDGTQVRIDLKQRVGFADRGDGGYIIGVDMGR
jgi:hypothetical protein